ncbi:hypothetical protein SLEP1_g60476 [Rubroshorea leprosula]|uniref:Beta-glucosidase n=1 Tax=Rubroshorea leprosula TaxID=152421 RepID=A0AAV5MVX0_9ROSI|nr:hypothetical protein SLEP1_g60476 [Rubroshorea leprosula]
MWCRFLHPLVYGDYPRVMKKNAGSRIPVFTNVESDQVKGSFDFIGINFYATFYIKDNPSSVDVELRDVNADMAAKMIPFEQNASVFEFPVTPWGLKGVLEYVKQTYGNPPVYIHENGLSHSYTHARTHTHTFK